jgi:hypothetical protein
MEELKKFWMEEVEEIVAENIDQTLQTEKDDDWDADKITTPGGTQTHPAADCLDKVADESVKAEQVQRPPPSEVQQPPFRCIIGHLLILTRAWLSNTPKVFRSATLVAVFMVISRLRVIYVTLPVVPMASTGRHPSQRPLPTRPECTLHLQERQSRPLGLILEYCSGWRRLLHRKVRVRLQVLARPRGV